MHRWRTWGPWVCVAAILGLIAWQITRSALDRMDRDRTTQNLKNIGLALHSYHEQWNCFPPAFVRGPDGTPWHSWRVLLLPHLGEHQLHSQYRYDEPWNGPHNRELLQHRPATYFSSPRGSLEPSTTTYLGVVSRRTMWPAGHCVRVQDVMDGTSNTIHLVEDLHSDVAWSEPRDLREHEALQLLRGEEDPATPVLEQELIGMLFVDGAVRRVRPTISREFFVALLTPRFGQSSTVNAEWIADAADQGEMAAQFPALVDPASLSNTRVTPYAADAIAPGRTTLFCATSQLAWDLLRPSAGAPVDCAGAAVGDLMNQQVFPLESLSPPYYFAGAARQGSVEERDMLKLFRRRFPNAPTKINPGSLAPGLMILTYLEKSLPFKDVLDEFDRPLNFQFESGSQLVRAFGRRSFSGAGAEMPVLTETVMIGDYVSNGEFIVRIHSDSPAGDEVIIALIPPVATLQETWKQVETRLLMPQGASFEEHLRAIDVLQIPVIACGLDAILQELAGLSVPTDAFPERIVAEARATIRFRLDEYGAELIADTYAAVAENGHGPDLTPPPPRPRFLICNRPFLLALREHSASAPYFLAWIGNADLMEAAQKN